MGYDIPSDHHGPDPRYDNMPKKRYCLDKYQDEAMRTANTDYASDTRLTAMLGVIVQDASAFNLHMGILVSALGLVGEAGEVADLVKKIYGHGHEYDHEKLDKEQGDVMWYTAALAKYRGRSLSSIGHKNIEKLKVRYAKGFTQAESQNRKDRDA